MRFLGPNRRIRVSEVGYVTEMIFIIIQYHKFLLLNFSFSVPYLLSERERKKAISLLKLGLRIRDVYAGSQILIFTHPGSRIPDPKTSTKEFFVFIPFFVATNITKLQIILFFYAEEKNLVQLSKIIELFTQKIVTQLSKIWDWDPGSRGQKGTGSRIRIRNTKLGIHFLCVPN